MSKVKRIKVALIGYGYWGPNLMRNLVSSPDFEVIGLVDRDEDSLESCRSLYPFVKVKTDLDNFLKENDPEAMVIATPPATHFEIAKKCLNAGAHILVEKPLTLKSREGEKLLEIAKTSFIKFSSSFSSLQHNNEYSMDKSIIQKNRFRIR